MTADLYYIDKSVVRASFDRAAARYDAAAVLQQEVRTRMLDRLHYIRTAPHTILDAGTGTGHAAQALARRYPGSRLLALDIALGMLQQTRLRQPWWSRMRGKGPGVICGDVEQLPLAAASVDMIWSNLVIQWCNDLDRVFMEMSRVLRPEGMLMFSTFGPDTLKELRAATAEDAAHVHVSRFIDMHDIGDALVRAGFSAPVLDVEHFTLTYADVLDVMRDLKAIGAHNAAAGRSRGLQGKGFLQGLRQRYEAFRGADGKLPATFEVVYGHAWKGAQNAQAQPDGAQLVRWHRRS